MTADWALEIKSTKIRCVDVISDFILLYSGYFEQIIKLWYTLEYIFGTFNKNQNHVDAKGLPGGYTENQQIKSIHISSMALRQFYVVHLLGVIYDSNYREYGNQGEK